MIGMPALSATDAQKKENIETRQQQIESGILKARELGLGEWKPEKAGRSFIKIAIDGDTEPKKS